MEEPKAGTPGLEGEAGLEGKEAQMGNGEGHIRRRQATGRQGMRIRHIRAMASGHPNQNGKEE